MIIRKKILNYYSFGIIIIFTSCINCGDRLYDDLKLINNSSDSLYFYIHPYKNENSYTYNIAYNVFDTGTINHIKYKYVIDFSNNDYAILPFDTLRPQIFQTTWKGFAESEGGLTLLFYKKKTLESISYEQPLTKKLIFKRIDLTNIQLDSLNYMIILN